MSLQESAIINLNDFINKKINRLKNLQEYMRRAVDRNIMVFDSLAKPGELSFRLFDLIVEENGPITDSYTEAKDLDLFYMINSYLVDVLGCYNNLNGKTKLLLTINDSDEPILAIY